MNAVRVIQSRFRNRNITSCFSDWFRGQPCDSALLAPSGFDAIPDGGRRYDALMRLKVASVASTYRDAPQAGRRWRTVLHRYRDVRRERSGLGVRRRKP